LILGADTADTNSFASYIIYKLLFADGGAALRLSFSRLLSGATMVDSSARFSWELLKSFWTI